jgi:hypothetical protein
MMSLALIASKGKDSIGAEKANNIFDALDLNKDGTLSLAEITKVLGESNAKEFLSCLGAIEKVGPFWSCLLHLHCLIFCALYIRAQDDNTIDREDFQVWAKESDSEFTRLDTQLRKICRGVTQGVLQLISAAAAKSAADVEIAKETPAPA